MDVDDEVSQRLSERLAAEIALRSSSTQTRLTSCDGVDIQPDFFAGGDYDMTKVQSLLVKDGKIWRHKNCEKLILESRTWVNIVVRCSECARFMTNKKRNINGLQKIQLSMTSKDPIFPTINAVAEAISMAAIAGDGERVTNLMRLIELMDISLLAGYVKVEKFFVLHCRGISISEFAVEHHVEVSEVVAKFQLLSYSIVSVSQKSVQHIKCPCYKVLEKMQSNANSICDDCFTLRRNVVKSLKGIAAVGADRTAPDSYVPLCLLTMNELKVRYGNNTAIRKLAEARMARLENKVAKLSSRLQTCEVELSKEAVGDISSIIGEASKADIGAILTELVRAQTEKSRPKKSSKQQQSGTAPPELSTEVIDKVAKQLKSQLENSAKDMMGQSKQIRYPPDMLALSLTIFCKSPATYNAVRDAGVFKFPCGKTVGRYKAAIASGSGEQSKPYRMAQLLQIPGTIYRGILLCDEFTIVSGLVVNSKNGKVTGVADDDLGFGMLTDMITGIISVIDGEDDVINNVPVSEMPTTPVAKK